MARNFSILPTGEVQHTSGDPLANPAVIIEALRRAVASLDKDANYPLIAPAIAVQSVDLSIDDPSITEVAGRKQIAMSVTLTVDAPAWDAVTFSALGA